MIKSIYKITNLINQKVYIGQSIHPEKRWWEHCQRAKTLYDNYPIHLAIRKYGEENFSFEILEWTENFNERERELIIYFNSLSPNGYNILEGGSTPILKGENHPRNSITEKQLFDIIDLLQQNEHTYKEIANMVNTTEKIISDINHGITHKIEGIGYPIRKNFQRKDRLTPQQVQEIKNYLQNSSLSYQEIANKFNTTKGNIGHINNGRTYKENINYPIRKENV